ncbi:MAG: glycosyltransferase family 1 protein, partial [Porticoccus sp.]|nr:glycosyltransferase family 1 protein [Porticoccus sp.]
MRVLLLSRYGRLGASSRVRSLQFIPFLESKGWDVDVRPLFSDDYLRALYRGRSRIVKVFWSYWYRLRSLMKIREYDLIWI